MQRPSAVRYAYADYLSIPEDTSRRYEIVDGELFVTAAPRFRHQRVTTNLVRLLGDLAEEHGLGEVVGGPITVHLHDEFVVEPDVLFIRADRLGIIDPEGGVEGPPDLVVEVLSPSNRDYDRNLKRKHYLEKGVAERSSYVKPAVPTLHCPLPRGRASWIRMHCGGYCQP